MSTDTQTTALTTLLHTVKTADAALITSTAAAWQRPSADARKALNDATIAAAEAGTDQAGLVSAINQSARLLFDYHFEGSTLVDPIGDSAHRGDFLYAVQYTASALNVADALDADTLAALTTNTLITSTEA